MIIVGYVWQILERVGPFHPLSREQPRKGPSWIGLRFISTYCKYYSSNHIFACLRVNWKKKSLDEKKFVRAVKMDISRSFDSIPHSLLISKVNVFEFWMDVVAHYSLLLKRCNQDARNDNTVYHILSSYVLQGSLVGQQLFNIFINDFIIFISGYQKWIF